MDDERWTMTVDGGLDMADAFVTGLTMLARRELSEAQLRHRLARKAFESDDIDHAIARLKADRSLDDERTAGAIARTEASARKRGKILVKRRIEAAGISSAIAQRAVDQVFQDADHEALLGAALDRRLRGKTIDDDNHRARLYRYLVRQGFESDRVLAILRRR